MAPITLLSGEFDASSLPDGEFLRVRSSSSTPAFETLWYQFPREFGSDAQSTQSRVLATRLFRTNPDNCTRDDFLNHYREYSVEVAGLISSITDEAVKPKMKSFLEGHPVSTAWGPAYDVRWVTVNKA